MSKKEKKSTENALPESVNDQITDAAQQSNIINVVEHPAFPYSQIYLNAGHSTGIMFQNSVNNQNNQNILDQAANNQGIIHIYSIPTIAAAGAPKYNFRFQPSYEKDNNQSDD
ncbi:MAG: body protein RebB-like protein [Chryseobacterium sp.]|jgi:hypothetical protein|uniref:RebB family R body protein n=1 Tax=Chryseobacterium sp. TaxID=1871047 RepID=UPI002602F75D|nr:RebB family R body protein [Chryseobacterium sp.]MDF2554082.1 body protein RebB-like protein [Chryseobacterium sp.]